jgi:hypothetical protein
MKEFEKKYFRITINGANEANIIMIFEAEMKLKNEINLTSSISVYAQNEKLGFLIKELNKIQLSKKFE